MTKLPLDPRAADVYASRVRDRLKERSCTGCGGVLDTAVVRFAGDGTTLEEYQLAEVSVAGVLAATQRLTLECGHCGAAVELGEVRGLDRARSVEPALPGLPWDTAVVEMYRSLVAARMAENLCSACGAALEAAELLQAAGGTSLDDYAVSDAAAARVLAATQRLSLRCRCGAITEI